MMEHKRRKPIVLSNTGVNFKFREIFIIRMVVRATARAIFIVSQSVNQSVICLGIDPLWDT
jgi:hypothetical protein